ncbi:bifunctional diguanylate cyclase/phosphodiesterase [Marinomonas balearica]|uniref:Diguanylate cyclase (GGDEF)-like protein n=1 Tax=Marinomonas balearica TaxID=491947 RepID=A0A4R6MH52_9GAMM|nr:EAL domain-containing protein [Marinomonas balearica]TDP01262.1 diguanylate cyclase (GGDEF)-like protein [Marinomonas balearica]
MLNTLKGRLYLIALLIVSPCYVFIYLSFDYSKASEKNELHRYADLISIQAVQNQDAIIASTRQFLTSLAAQPPLQRPDSKECQQFVQRLTYLDDRYANIGVPNAQGILTCNGTKLNAPVNVVDRGYIKEALTEKRFTTSGALTDRAIGQPTINFAYPVWSDADPEGNNVVGAAVVVISLDWWADLLSSIELPNKSLAYVLDAKGNAVASFPKNSEYEPVESPFLASDIIKGHDGVERIFIEYDVKDDLGRVMLTFVTGIAVDEALADIDARYSFIFALFTAFVVALLLLLRIFFLNSILGPLNTLSNMTFRMGLNEKITEKDATGVKEMDQLQNRFMVMAERKEQAEQKMIQQAQTDLLTGIGNRERFNQGLINALQETKRHNHQCALLLIDLDLFKEINDTRGHQVGDEILRVAAKRLQALCPKEQLICRLGGDEFIFLLSGAGVNNDYVHDFCQNIQSQICTPFDIYDEEIFISSSIGIATFPRDGSDERELMAAADQALYSAKHAGRNQIKDFNVELKYALLEKIELVKDLRNAIANNEFHLVFQPIVNRFGKVVKFEALIRWSHPTKGLIPPDQFIGYAEESGQIIMIGEWVILEAKMALEKLKGLYGEEIQVSVNVSPLQLSNSQSDSTKLLYELLTGVFSESTPNKNGLIVEITENVFMSSEEGAQQQLLNFRKHGIQVALDDFGTGYSSLAYIMNYQMDYLKIDKTFVSRLDGPESSVSLCEGMIAMAHSLGMTVVAEGVETSEQAALLCEYGCDYLQGYYYSKPKRLDEILGREVDQNVTNT